jgi:hypothetical protein
MSRMDGGLRSHGDSDRQWDDQYLSPKPMRLLRRKADKTPVVAALVAEGAPVLAADEIELVPGPGFPRYAKRR